MKFPWQKKANSAPLNGTAIRNQSYTYKVYSFSETGPTRGSNEDNITYFFRGNTKQTLFAMVADGMGGHNAGEVASHIACQVAEELLSEEYLKTDLRSMLNGLIHSMHHAIKSAANTNEAYSGMGTTATTLLIQADHFAFGHVGDSRLYRFHHHVLEQLTTDQTLVNQMVAQGKIEAHEAHTHDMKHVLLQALGTVDIIEPEVSQEYLLENGDYYFLCSDGVYDVLSNEELQSLLAMRQPALAMESIKALCYGRNAKDNVSALLVEVIPFIAATNNSVTREQNAML